MNNWSELEYEKFQARKQDWGDNTGVEADPGLESVLQGKIVDWAKERGYPCLSFWKSKRLKRLPGYRAGWPDITLALKGKVLFFELKSASGPLRAKQRELSMQLLALGHEWYQCRSYKQFLEIMKGRK